MIAAFWAEGQRMSITKVSHIHHHYEEVGENVLSPMWRHNKYLEKSFDIKWYTLESFDFFGKYFWQQYKELVEVKKKVHTPYLVDSFLESSYNSLSTVSDYKTRIDITPSIEK